MPGPEPRTPRSRTRAGSARHRWRRSGTGCWSSGPQRLRRLSADDAWSFAVAPLDAGDQGAAAVAPRRRAADGPLAGGPRGPPGPRDGDDRRRGGAERAGGGPALVHAAPPRGRRHHERRGGCPRGGGVGPGHRARATGDRALGARPMRRLRPRCRPVVQPLRPLPGRRRRPRARRGTRDRRARPTARAPGAQPPDAGRRAPSAVAASAPDDSRMPGRCSRRPAVWSEIPLERGPDGGLSPTTRARLMSRPDDEAQRGDRLRLRPRGGDGAAWRRSGAARGRARGVRGGAARQGAAPGARLLARDRAHVGRPARRPIAA